MHCGQEDTAPNTMEHPISYSAPVEAVYSAAGKAQLKEQVAYYMNNAQYILKGLQEAGFTVSGGVNAPYIWLKAPNGMTSWEFFDYLLENVNVVVRPDRFGPSGEHYFRLTLSEAMRIPWRQWIV